MVIQLSVIYLGIINYNLDLVGIINLSLITILVLITGAYGYFTWQIVDDQRKSRQMDYTSKRLEKFYYPVLNFLNSYIYIVSVDSKPELRVRDNIFDIERRNSNPDYKDIVRHQYLMKNNRNYSALLKFRPTHLVSPVPKLKYPLIHYPKMEQMAFR